MSSVPKTPTLKSVSETPGTPLHSRPSTTRAFIGGAFCLALLFISSHLRPADLWQVGFPSQRHRHSRKNGAEFDWIKIQPREYFEFHECFDGLQCARLSVPMDWNNASMPDRVAIAVIKQPAKVPVTDSRYAGPILMNPGGPGGAGVYQVLSGGRYIQTIVDPHLDPDKGGEGKYYDVIGFDPRTVGDTTPHLTCFPDGVAAYNWLQDAGSDYLLGASDFVFDREWARNDVLGNSCAARHGEKPNIAHFANTAQVVEDMVAIVERHGEWRGREAKRLLSCRMHISDSKARRSIIEQTAWRKGRENLSYWGFSYGTVLGQTFAAMHSDRVNRLVIDGVVDAKDYYSANWAKNLQDTNKIGQIWNDYCRKSGSRQRCPFYDENMPGGFVPSMIGIITNKLLERPLPLPDLGQGPMILDHSDIMDLLVDAFYEPFRSLGLFSEITGEVYLNNPNISRAASWKARRIHSRPSVSQACQDDEPYSPACVAGLPRIFSSIAIRCSDGADITNKTKDEHKELMEKLQRQSDVFGAFWSSIPLSCIGWKARPTWRFEGPIEGKTAFPLLMIGNSRDPVTPLENAYNAAKLFPGSVVLHQNTEGHCSYSSPSIATAKVIRDYFQHGNLPKLGTITQPEWLPFIGLGNSSNRSDVDEKIWLAQSSLAPVWPSSAN